METEVEVYKAGEVAPPSNGDGLDTQIATAKQYPRNLKKFIKNTVALVCKNESVAASCVYSLPRAGKTIEGRTVRFAEIVALNYGNLRVSDRIVMETDKEVVAEAIAFDMENNVAIKSEVPISILNKEGVRYDEHMILTTKRAAQSKARRNAILTIIPPVITESIELAIDKTLLVTGADFESRKTKCIEYLKNNGIGEKEICSLLLIKNISDMNQAHLRTVRGMVMGIENKEFTAETLLQGMEKKGASDISSAANRRRKQQQNQGVGQSETKTETPNEGN